MNHLFVPKLHINVSPSVVFQRKIPEFIVDRSYVESKPHHRGPSTTKLTTSTGFA